MAVATEIKIESFNDIKPDFRVESFNDIEPYVDILSTAAPESMTQKQINERTKSVYDLSIQNKVPINEVSKTFGEKVKDLIVLSDNLLSDNWILLFGCIYLIISDISASNIERVD